MYVYMYIHIFKFIYIYIHIYIDLIYIYIFVYIYAYVSEVSLSLAHTCASGCNPAFIPIEIKRESKGERASARERERPITAKEELAYPQQLKNNEEGTTSKHHLPEKKFKPTSNAP